MLALLQCILLNQNSCLKESLFSLRNLGISWTHMPEWKQAFPLLDWVSIFSSIMMIILSWKHQNLGLMRSQRLNLTKQSYRTLSLSQKTQILYFVTCENTTSNSKIVINKGRVELPSPQFFLGVFPPHIIYLFLGKDQDSLLGLCRPSSNPAAFLCLRTEGR